MDSIDDSPLSHLVMLLADHADRFQESWLTVLLSSLCFTLYYSLFGGRTDVVLIALAASLTSPARLQYFLAGQVRLIITSILFIAGALFLFKLTTLTVLPLFTAPSATVRKESAGSFFIPSRTTHSRFFPKKHSFAYSYLTVGVPIGLRSSVNGILAVDPTASSSGRSWWAWLLSPLYEVDSARYLARGDDSGGLRSKLDRFLSSQDGNPEAYPYAFLVTAPEFLGYSFNPVSFWYLYSPDKILSAMILEVNNTFDERRPYLVLRDFEKESKHIQSSTPSETTDKPAKISAAFEKDFHVSPFNSRKGSYSVLAQDPLGPNMQGFRGLEVAINLSSSKGHPKLVARLVNQEPAVEVARMSTLQKLIFVSRFFWIGFATFPRIVKEAGVLFFRRSLHVWYRPEPLKQSLGRHGTPTERQLEPVFRAYLRHRVEQSPKSVRVRYIPSGLGTATEDVFTSRAVKGAGEADHEFEMRVLTPVFYARFVHYAHDFEGIFSELVESHTIAVDKPDLLPIVFLKKGAPPFHTANLVEYVYFKLMQTLRRTPEAIHRPLTSADHGAAAKHPSGGRPVDIRDFRISSMDAYVLEHGSEQLKRTYRSAVSRLFVADRCFCGSEELLLVVLFIWRAALAHAFVSLSFM